MPYVISIADDLTGAAESAAALAGLPAGGLRSLGSAVVLSPAPAELPDHRVVVLDTDTRSAPADEAAAATVEAVRRAFSHLDGGGRGLVFKKLDSMLRGNTRDELRAVAGRWPLVLAPALPVQGRTVTNGILTAAGARHRLADLLPEKRTFPVTLRDVRGPVARLVDSLRSALGSGGTPIVDAETDADLDAVATAVAELPGVLLAGSGGLASALGRRRPADPPAASPTGPAGPTGTTGPAMPTERSTPTVPTIRYGVPKGIVTVVGTSEPGARRQLACLEDAGVAVRLLPAEALLEGSWHSFGDPPERHLAYAIDGPVRHEERIRQRLASGLATAVLAAHPDADFLVTGGQTAKALLNALGQSVLFPAAVVHPGAIISVDPTGRIVATRPGSFGAPDSLARMLSAVARMRTPPADAPTSTRKALP
jgi:uncharacterized protein YgbK (DUF1537 family)